MDIGKQLPKHFSEYPENNNFEEYFSFKSQQKCGHSHRRRRLLKG